MSARTIAQRLAISYDDLVVVSQEPSNLGEDVPYDEMFFRSTALQCVDGTLRMAFENQRCVENTIILDVRPFGAIGPGCDKGRMNDTGKTKLPATDSGRSSIYYALRSLLSVSVDLVVTNTS